VSVAWMWTHIHIHAVEVDCVRGVEVDCVRGGISVHR
jgi:hypothetical protein